MKKLLISASGITFLVMVINFLFKIYLSYQIPKSSLGLFYTFMDIITLGAIASAGFKDSLIKAYDEGSFQSVLFWYIVSFWTLFTTILILILLYYINFFEDFLSPWHLMAIFSAQSVTLFLSYLNSAWKVYRVMLFETLVMVLGILLSFFIFSIFMSRIEALFFSFLSGYVVRAVYIKTLSPIDFKYQKSSLKSAKKFLKNNLLSSLMYFFSGLFISSSSLVILKLFRDIEFLSHFQVVIRSIFFSLVAIFVFPINSFTFPELSKLISQKNIKEIITLERSLVKYLLIFGILIFLLLPLTKVAISLIFPPEYASSYRELNIILPILPFIAYTTFSINIIKGFDRFDLALYVRVFGSLIFFISVFLLYTFKFDAVGVIYSLDISFLAMFLLSLSIKRGLLKSQ